MCSNMKIYIPFIALISLRQFSPTLAEPKAKAQLGLPPISTPTPQPDIYYNGYTANSVTTPAQIAGDLSRSQRYGPPYSDDATSEDRNDDFRYGQVYEDRMRNGYNYQPPFSNYSRNSPSPFSSDQFRYQNHNYDNVNRYADNYNQQQYLRVYNNNPGNNQPQDYYRYNQQPTPTPPPYNPTSTYNPNSQYNPSLTYNPNSPYNPTSTYNPNSQYNPTPTPYPNNPYDPSRPRYGQDERNRFQNPYRSNQDHYNLNEREQQQQRHQQDRRYQIELEKLRTFLVETNQRSMQECTANVAAQWNFETNVNEFTQAEALNAQQRYVEFQRLVAEQSRHINKDLIFDRRLFRELMLQSDVGPNGLPPETADRYNRLINEMLNLYNGASICAYQQPFHCDLRYIPDLKEIMAKSRDWEELEHTWVEYHRKAGRNMRDSFSQLIDVMQEVANVNNVTNGGEYWYLSYESGNFRQDVDIIWEQIRPLYEELHAYIRRKLRDYYGPDRINNIAPIPSHVLGNMFGQSWSNILDIVIPYPGRKLVDVTPRMLEQGYTPLLMVQLAEEFFTSINMSAVGSDFYRNSLIEQPPDRQVLCEPSAWDFCNRHDFRIKLCTQINQKSFVSVHHEMAHIQYFLQYRHLEKIFRNGANPAFHQAIGDAIALSVTTPKHFQTLGLLQRPVDELSYDINYLFTMAIDKVAFLPFALALDNWRYDLFSGNVKKNLMNCHFWNLREQYSGIKPPQLRSEQDFDMGAKFHVPANIPYIKYFVSTVLQFQIYRGMCLRSGQYLPDDPQKPLHKCDIYRQPKAGNLLKEIMSKGASLPWQEVLQQTLGEGRLDGGALREYFAPLEEWLRQENLRTQQAVGWNYDGEYCKRSLETANLQVYGGFYNSQETVRASLVLMVMSIFLVYRMYSIYATHW